MDITWNFKPFACGESNDDDIRINGNGNSLESDLEDSKLGNSYDSDSDHHTIGEIVIPSIESEDLEESEIQSILSAKAPPQNPDTLNSTPHYYYNELEDFNRGGSVSTNECTTQNENDDSSFSCTSISESENSFSSSDTEDQNDDSFAYSVSNISIDEVKSLTNSPKGITEKGGIQDCGDDAIQNQSVENFNIAEDKYEIETILAKEDSDRCKDDDISTEKKLLPEVENQRRRQLKKRVSRETSPSSLYYGSFIAFMLILIIYFSIRLHRVHSREDTSEVIKSSEERMEKLQYVASEQILAKPPSRRGLRG